MRLLPPALFASLLVLAPTACNRDGGNSSSPTDSTTARPRGPKMPKPLKLPAQPQGLVHLDSPKAFLDTLLAYAGEAPEPRTLMQQAVDRSGLSFERQVLQHVGINRAWNMAQVDGETIVHVPVRPAAVKQVAAMLSSLAAEGDFGAVKLARAQGERGPKLAYLDQDNGMLTLADSLRGIATGPELGRTYGRRGVNLRITAEQAARYGAELGVESITAVGDGALNLELTVRGAPPLPPEARIENGALTGLLENPQIAAGVSTKYSDSKADVDRIIRNARGQISKLPGLAQGNAKELLGRAAAMMRTWNGRAMVGVGPTNHVLVGLGASDPEKMNKSTQYFMRGVMSNIKTLKSLRSFGVKLDIPGVRFAPNTAEAAGHKFHMVGLDGARKYVPSEFHRLINKDGRLRIAMAFPKRTGAGMMVIGPDAKAVMSKWLAEVKDATPAGKSAGHLIAATVAVDGTAVAPLLNGAGGPETVAAILGLKATRKPAKIVLRTIDGGYVVRLQQATGASGSAKTAIP